MSRAASKSLETGTRLLACRPSTTSPSLPHIPSPWRPSLCSSAITFLRPMRRNGFLQVRHSSHSPLGIPSANARKKVTLQTIQSLYKKGEPITMLTAYDFPSAHVADHAGMDIILVGDSLAMVSMGLEDTAEVTMDDMIFAARSVGRATKSAFIVGDLPMGSYEVSPQQAVTTSIRMIKEGRTHAIKLEGGAEIAPTISAITRAGIPVLAHVGLTPQRQNALGGFRVQGKTAKGAMGVLEDALAVQEAGAFGVVLEAVPPEMAEIITKKLRIPTIGIGAGNGTSGQVLVQVDMLGNFPPGRYLPKFVKKYGDVWSEALRAIEQYKDEVKSKAYPGREFSYATKPEEVRNFEDAVIRRFGGGEGKADDKVQGLGATAVAE